MPTFKITDIFEITGKGHVLSGYLIGDGVVLSGDHAVLKIDDDELVFNIAGVTLQNEASHFGLLVSFSDFARLSAYHLRGKEINVINVSERKPLREKVPIRTFNFEVNATFARETLRKLGIETEIRENDAKQFQLIGDSDIQAKATHELHKLDLDEAPLNKASEGYLEEVNEWSDHMYNPVYWLERKKLPPLLYSKASKRLIGILFLAPSLILFMVNALHRNYSFPEGGYVHVLSLIFGLILIGQSFKKTKTES